MFNTKGEVIGINFAIVSPTGNNIGIGFAVPSSVAKPIVEQLMKDGKVHHGWIGVAIQPTDEVAESLGLKEGVGSLISNIATGSPAEKAGIQVGDIILKFDGKEITNFKKLPRIVAGTPVGTKVNVELMSKGKLKNITLIVGEIDGKIEAAAVNNNISPKAVKSLYGMNLSSITPEIRKILNIPNDINGIFVSSLDKKSLAAKHGIKAGDVINSANQKLLKKPEDLFSIIEEAKINQRKSIMLLINRAGGNVFLSLPVTK